MKSLLPTALAFAAGVLVMVLMTPEPKVHYQEVIVPDTVILEREPDTVRTFVDRIQYRVVEPTQVAITQGGAATGALESFCRPVTVVDKQTDTLVIEKQVLLRSVTFDDGWFWRRGDLLLTGITNTGELTAIDAKTRADFSAVAAGESVLIRESRWSWLQPVAEISAVAGLTWLLTR